MSPRIGPSELEELIARVNDTVAEYQVTGEFLGSIVRGTTPPLLLATDQAILYQFPPDIETIRYLVGIVGAPLAQLRADLALVELPTVAELPERWAEARKVPHYRGIYQLFASRPVAGEKVVAWAQNLDLPAISTLCRGVLSALVVRAEDHQEAIAADLTRRTGWDVTWVTTAQLRSHRIAISRLAQFAATEEELLSAVTTAGAQLVERQVQAHLSESSPEVLEQVTEDRLRLGALRSLSVEQIAKARPEDLQRIDGVGDKTARRAIAAARAYRRTLIESAAPRIDYTNKAPSTDYVIALARLLSFRDLTKRLPEGPFLEVPEVTEDTVVACAAAHPEELHWLSEAEVPEPIAPPLSAEEAWALYAVRAAEFHAFGDNGAAQTGGLPAEIVDRVAAVTLQGKLHASLRGYQAFGAKFVIAQHKVLIGDEMGLGKTLQALAAIVHVAATHSGPCQALVVCPPSLRLNWQREAERFTDLETFLIHGPGKEARFAAWEQRGGIAIVGYPEVRRNPRFTDPDEDVEILVVDEAHRVKNELSQQSQAVGLMTAAAGYTVYLTGTPLENRISEFQTLIRYLDPEIDTATTTPVQFRSRIAPVYLRRNQEQVLDELPPLTETEEWVEPTKTDEARYAEAVTAGNFMAMRAACSGVHSAKLDRLIELISESGSEKTIVFTYFREVIDATLSRLADAAIPTFGPIAGGVSLEERQRQVDAFSSAASGAVLICQITAAGEGLNIQAANRIIIVEPQLNPAIEAQAIARAHRMGQVRTVEVHRLLTPDAVDERLVQALKHKKALFERYARDSAAAYASPEAVDVSEAKLIEQLVAAERERLAKGPRL